MCVKMIGVIQDGSSIRSGALTLPHEKQRMGIIIVCEVVELRAGAMELSC